MVVEEVPVAGILADCDDGDKESGCSGQVGCLEAKPELDTNPGLLIDRSKIDIVPALPAFPTPATCRWHLGHRSVDGQHPGKPSIRTGRSNLCELLRLRNQLVSILAVVLLGLENAVGHGDEVLLRHGFRLVSGIENGKIGLS